jgi:ABC-type transport system involved in multi-copper enzyme maturation permease subunit
MFRTLVSKEILNNLLNYRFILAYFVCTVLLVSSAAVQYADFLARKHNYDLNTNVFRNRMDGDLRWYEYFNSIWVSRPPRLLSVFAAGAEQEPNATAHITLNESPDFRGELRRNPLRSFFPALDTVFIVGIIMSLLVCMLTFDAISGERESGTLKVLLSGPVPRGTVYLAKWIGGLICLLFPFLTSIGLMAVVLVFSSSLSIAPDVWARMAGIAGICVLYIAVVFSLSMMVSVLARSSATIVLALLVLWAVFIVAIPAMSAPLSHLLINPPSVEKTETFNHRDYGQRIKMPRTFDDCVAQQYAARGIKPNQPLTGQQQDLRDWIGFLCSGKTMWPLLADTIIAAERVRDRSVNAVDHLASWLSRVSPYGCLQHACVTLAGTGAEYEDALTRALYANGRDHIAFFLKQLEQNEGAWRVSSTGSPRFPVPQLVLSQDIARVVIDAGILALMGVLFFLAGFGVFVRREVA